MTVESVFRYFYWAINAGALVGQALCPTLSHQSFSLAFMVPAIVFVIGIIVFASGRSKYIGGGADGTVLKKTWGCMRYAMRNKGGAPVTHWLDRSKVPGQLWDDVFVDDLKRTLKACSVFLFYPFYWALYSNMSDNFINQGINMKRPDWLGPEQLNVVNSLVLVLTIPIFDQFIFPRLRKAGFRLGPIARITIGFAIVVLGFVYVTILQDKLYKTGPWYNFTDLTGLKEKYPVNDISVWWQLPPYIVIAISEIFASATGLEFAYKQAPPDLKSIVMALFLLTNCGGSLIGMLLAIWSKDPLFVDVFAVQTALMAVMGTIFWFLFRKLDDDE